jgi:2-keto-3-deoxy-L-rhamnonate aldolase RhmA
MEPKDLFTDESGNPRVLMGCGISSGSPRFAELAARMGFDVVWIEMEHAAADLAGAEAMCVAAEAGGAIPLIRAAGYGRQHILHPLEVGARIVVVPLVNDATAAREVVRHGKFRPLGRRGFNTRSRAFTFGADPQAMERANNETYLMPQVESLEAAKNLDGILAVQGLSGIFIGPGDLSADLGRPSRFDDAQLRDTVCQCIAKSRDAGLHAGILVGEGPLLDAALDAGADLCIVGSDMGAAISTWRAQLERLGAFSIRDC